MTITLTTIHRQTLQIPLPVVQQPCPVCQRPIEMMTTTQAAEALEVDFQGLAELM